MPQLPDEPLTKITLNLYAKDVAILKEIFPESYTVQIRDIVRKWLKAAGAPTYE